MLRARIGLVALFVPAGRRFFFAVPMEETSIRLLTREGGIRVTFRPALTSERYAALLGAIEHDGDTVAELSKVLQQLAESWDSGVLIDVC